MDKGSDCKPDNYEFKSHRLLHFKENTIMRKEVAICLDEIEYAQKLRRTSKQPYLNTWILKQKNKLKELSFKGKIKKVI